MNRKNQIPCFLLIFFTFFIRINSIYGIFQLDNIEIKKYQITTINFYKNQSKEIRFKLKLHNIYYNALIWQRTSEIISNTKSTINIIDNKTKSDPENNIKLFSSERHFNEHLYQGYLLEIPNNSSLSGYILGSGNAENDNECFVGRLIINNRLYYIEKLNNNGYLRFNLNDDLLIVNNTNQDGGNVAIYAGDEVEMKINENKNIVRQSRHRKTDPLKYVQMSQEEFVKVFKKWKKNGLLCSLIVVVDYSFLTLVHNGNIESATFHIILSLEEANAIFRSTDFDNDGSPDNIGFFINKLIIINDPDQHGDFIQKFSEEFVNVPKFLFKFTQFKELSNHCLGLLFTAQLFYDNTLGASLVPDISHFEIQGGICEVINTGHNQINLNGLVITGRTIEGLNPQILFETTIAHELGHSFGSKHDALLSYCYGHLMSSTSFSDYKSRIHLTFSECSKEQIIRALVAQGSCFKAVEEPFCGNGIIEPGEACDCGLTGDCLSKDPCCIPRRTRHEPCTVNKEIGYDCHPSEGKCCTRNCRYALHEFLDCEGFNKFCPCIGNASQCDCGINGQCIGNECHSMECTRLKLKECVCNGEKTWNRRGATCQICCQSQSQCLPSIQLTEEILAKNKDNKLFFKQLMIDSKKTEIRRQRRLSFSRETTRTYCQNVDETDDGERHVEICIHLRFFQSANYGDDCLINGKLGKCIGNYRCDVLAKKQIFPLINKGVSKKFSYEISVFFILFLSIKLLL